MTLFISRYGALWFKLPRWLDILFVFSMIHFIHSTCAVMTSTGGDFIPWRYHSLWEGTISYPPNSTGYSWEEMLRWALGVVRWAGGPWEALEPALGGILSDSWEVHSCSTLGPGWASHWNSGVTVESRETPPVSWWEVIAILPHLDFIGWFSRWRDVASDHHSCHLHYDGRAWAFIHSIYVGHSFDDDLTTFRGGHSADFPGTHSFILCIGALSGRRWWSLLWVPHLMILFDRGNTDIGTYSTCYTFITIYSLPTFCYSVQISFIPVEQFYILLGSSDIHSLIHFLPFTIALWPLSLYIPTSLLLILPDLIDYTFHSDVTDAIHYLFSWYIPWRLFSHLFRHSVPFITTHLSSLFIVHGGIQVTSILESRFIHW